MVCKIENFDVGTHDYRSLFNQLDLKKGGKVTFEEFQTALGKIDHPTSQDQELIKSLFGSIDLDNDKIIDFDDVQQYFKKTDEQIAAGFKKIDVNNDGKLSRLEMVNYMKNELHLDPTDADIDFIFNTVDYKSSEYITYEKFRNFLLFIPRLEGSRVRNAFKLVSAKVNLSSEGDVIVDQQFVEGIEFFLAGGISGVVSRTCTAPLDRIRMFLVARTDLSSTMLSSKSTIAKRIAEGAPKHQIEEAIKTAAQKSSEGHNHASKVPKIIRSPIVQAARTLWQQGGIRTFFVGNGLNAVKVFPESAVKFGSFEGTKRLLANIEGVNEVSDLSSVSVFFAGGVGGLVGQFTVYPIDTVKFRLQCADIQSSSKGNELLIQTAKELFQKGGIRSFYRGLLIGSAGIFPYSALDLGTFTTMKNWFIKRECKKNPKIREEDVKLSNFKVLSLGALSGTISGTLVYPINLIRTRLQAQGTYAHPSTYNGFNDVLMKTISKEGYSGLYKGLVPNLVKAVPAVSISYFMYENTKALFGLKNA